MAKYDKGVKQSKRLYIAADELGFLICNPQLFLLLSQDFHLSALEILLFMVLHYKYDSSGCKPVSASLGDWARALGCTKSGIIEVINNLLAWGIIKRVNERQGRAKSQYVPNV